MREEIAHLHAAIAAFEFAQPSDIDAFKSQFSGRKGAIPALFKQLKDVPAEERAAVGQLLNALKQAAQERLDAAQNTSPSKSLGLSPDDPTLPGTAHFMGTRHPLRIVLNRLVTVFERLGFSVVEGPEIEDDWHNFGALNFPPDHPARDMQDTFFVAPPQNATETAPWLLRTHTSSVQVRTMETTPPPIRIIAPGRVYRNEAVSARAHCFFHQVEGLVVDKNVSFRDLKYTLEYFVKQIFGPAVQTKLRPSYFPFTEISAELDISCLVCGGEGCAVCKNSGWVEVLGCGMVDPNVLEACNIDPDVYTGYAFGMGVERIAQLLFRVPDLRLYSQNDLRFLNQFTGVY